MVHIDKSKPVLVTGATGYVAGCLVRKLLEDGYTVHAPIRNPQNIDSRMHLDVLAEKLNGKIRYFQADLLKEGSYEEAMQGCELVYHMASPFKNQVKDPQRDLIDPALVGTINVLNSVNQVQSVKRVVLTSSIAAIIGDAIDCQAYPNQIATEEQWNTTSSLKHQPYSYSKTLAEREAWKINAAQNRWDLIVINPALVIGPGVKIHQDSESFKLVKQIGDGSMKMGAPDFNIGVVDVRNVAEAHYRAGFMPEAKGRYIVSAGEAGFLSLSQILKDKFGNSYPFPKKTLPKWFVWLMAPAVGFSRKMIKNNVGLHWNIDHSKSINELHIEYLPIEKSIVDFFQQMIDEKVV